VYNCLQMSITSAFATIPQKQVFYLYPKKGIFFKRLDRWFFIGKFVCIF
jgi:hypothetical protein